MGRLLAQALLLPLLLVGPLLLGSPAWAAEVLQVREATLLQVGDHNRSYPVALACLQLEPEQRQPAIEWLRQQLPRRTKVNLRPIGSRDGVLLARVSPLGGRTTDLAEGLVAAGLAQPAPCAP
ncbi:MAG: hypothetical protein VKM01_08940 [Cyanobacteriota bacterium]|jgi:hypothetical protein|nr:hypothetical protein [Cyanobacteriota bacterium]